MFLSIFHSRFETRRADAHGASKALRSRSGDQIRRTGDRGGEPSASEHEALAWCTGAVCSTDVRCAAASGNGAVQVATLATVAGAAAQQVCTGAGRLLW